MSILEDRMYLLKQMGTLPSIQQHYFQTEPVFAQTVWIPGVTRLTSLFTPYSHLQTDGQYYNHPEIPLLVIGNIQ